MGPQVADKTGLFPPPTLEGLTPRVPLRDACRESPWLMPALPSDTDLLWTVGHAALERHLPRITEMSGEAALTWSQAQPDTGDFLHQPARKHVG